jgi:ankyrin repeat protein
MSTSIQSFLDRARVLQEQGDGDGAISVLHDVLKVLAAEIAESEQRWAGLGGVYDAAYAAKEESDRLHADQAMVQKVLDELLQKTGRTAKVTQVFQQVVQVQTDTDGSRSLTEKIPDSLQDLGMIASEEQVKELVQRIEADLQSILSSLAENLTGEAKHEIRLLQDWVKEAPLPEEARSWVLAVTEECRNILVMKGSLGIPDAEEGLRWIYFDLAKRGANDAFAGKDQDKERQWLIRVKNLGINIGREDSPLHVAVKRGDEAEVRQILGSGAAVNEAGAGRNIPLHLAAGASPAHRSPQARDGTIAALLLGRGADVHVMNGDGEIPLHRAAQAGNSAAVLLLVAHGSDINAKTLEDTTPLQCAAVGGHEPIVQFLIKQGGDVRARASNGGTALHRAAEGGHEGVARLLLDCGADVNAQEQTAVYSRAPLHWASRGGNEALVRLLLDHGAGINVGAETGRSPLHEAALSGHEAVTCLLLERGADVQAKDPEGRTALHMAASKGHVGIAHLLLRQGVDRGATDQRGKTSLDLAREWGRTAIVELLERT